MLVLDKILAVALPSLISRHRTYYPNRDFQCLIRVDILKSVAFVALGQNVRGIREELYMSS